MGGVDVGLGVWTGVSVSCRADWRSSGTGRLLLSGGDVLSKAQRAPTPESNFVHTAILFVGRLHHFILPAAAFCSLISLQPRFTRLSLLAAIPQQLARLAV